MNVSQRQVALLLLGLLVSATAEVEPNGEAQIPEPSLDGDLLSEGLGEDEEIISLDDHVPPAPPATQDNFVPDFMKETTVPSGSMVISEHMDSFGENEKNLAQLDTLSNAEKLDLVESLKDSMLTMDAKIDGVDLSDPKLEGIKALTDVGRDYTYKAVQAVEDALTYMRSMTTTEASSGEDTKGYTRGEISRRLALESDAEEDEDDEEEWEEYDNTWRGNAEYKRGNTGHHWQQRKKTKDKFNGFNHHGDTFHRRANSHHTRKLHDFQNSIYHGNIHSAFSHFATGHHASSAGPTKESKARRLAANQARRLSKREQCELLSDCVIGMR